MKARQRIALFHLRVWSDYTRPCRRTPITHSQNAHDQELFFAGISRRVRRGQNYYAPSSCNIAHSGTGADTARRISIQLASKYVIRSRRTAECLSERKIGSLCAFTLSYIG